MSESEPVHILYIGDDAGDARLVKGRLEQAAYIVHVAGDDQDGLAGYIAGRYAAVMVDRRAAAKGLETIRQLAAQSPLSPLIIIVPLGNEAVIGQAMELGVSHYLIKDVEGGYLELAPVVIRQALHQKRLDDERRQALDELKRVNSELAVLNVVGQKISSTLDLDQVLSNVLDEVRHLLGIVAASVWLIDADTGELVCRQNTGPHSQILRGWRMPLGQGTVGWVVLNNQSLIIADTRQDPRHFKGVDRRTGIELRSILNVPLRVKEKVIGALQVVDTRVGRFDMDDLNLLEPLAASAAIAIENARLYEQAQLEIAERKRVEEALRHRTAELQARNEELDAFAHTVAHDIKGIAGRIVGYTLLLEEDFDQLPADEAKEYLGTISRSGRKMSAIIDELLLLAGVRSMRPQTAPLDMAAIVAEVLQRLHDLIAESQAQIILPQSWPLAEGYAPWIEEVWVNYVSNAIKYGGNPPHVEIGATVLPAPPGDADTGRGQVRFWVRDNGNGLTPEEQSRLFVPFSRLDQVTIKGYGLGLSIVRRIVEKLGGQVGVASAVGQGSTFSFTLPAVSWSG